jgi:hypothetical protein
MFITFIVWLVFSMMIAAGVGDLTSTAVGFIVFGTLGLLGMINNAICHKLKLFNQ